MKKIFFIAISVLLCLCCLAGCSSSLCTVPEGAGTKSYDAKQYRTTMQYYSDFKILQLTDLHLGIETDVAKQLDIVRKAIRTEKPDLIILTGDNFMYASKGVVRALVDTLNEECERLTLDRGRLAKFTLTFGNHDNQGDYSRYYINEVISSYVAKDGEERAQGKYAAFVDFEDDDVFGLANFYIDLVTDRSAPEDKADVKYRIHIIDSNTYHYMGTEYDYDVIHQNQLDHAQSIYGESSDKDYIGLAFFHIPFYEFGEAWEQMQSSPTPELVGQGEHREGVLAAYENNGAYQKLRNANIVAFFCGHDHINYGDFIYNASSDNVADKAIFSYGVKATNQLYHDTDMMGYKTVTLRDVSADEFISMEYVKQNFKNETGGYANYEKD